MSVCHGHLAWNSWGNGARPPRVSKPGRQRYWMSRQKHLQQIAVSNQARSLARLGSYGRPRPSMVRVHPSRRLGGLPDRTTWSPNQSPLFNFTSLSRTKLSCQVRPRGRHGLGGFLGELVFFQTTTFNLLEACERPRIESRSQALGQTGLSNCQDTPIINSLLSPILGAHHSVGQPSPPSPCHAPHFQMCQCQSGGRGSEVGCVWEAANEAVALYFMCTE